MGNKQNQDVPKLRRSELTEFSRQSLLNQNVVEKLYTTFYRISNTKSEDGVIDLSEFCLRIKGKEASMVSEGVFNMFDANYDGFINFREFIMGISVFSESHDALHKENTRVATIRVRDKIEYAVRIADFKKKKRVYLRDVRKLLTALMEEKTLFKLPSRMIKKIVKNTFNTENILKDEQGEYWDLQCFSNMAMKNPQIFKWLSVNLDLPLQTGKSKEDVKKSWTSF